MRLALCVALCGCGDEIQWTEARITLQRPMASTCRLDPLAPLTVHALGDFAPSGNLVEPIDPARGVASFDRFPLATRTLRFEVGSPDPIAGGSLDLPIDEPRPVLLLPLSRSCPSPDVEARARLGAAIAALPGGDLLIAGGNDDDLGGTTPGAATATAVVLPAGSELVEQVSGGMFLRRSGATATVIGDAVWVVGGGAHDRGPAHETYERFDRVTRSFEATAGAMLFHGPRREHGAIALADGRVLIAGGVSELGEMPLTSVEAIDDDGAHDVGTLAHGRVRPNLIALSDGSVLIVGGLDSSQRAIGAIERFSADAGVEQLAVAFPNADLAASAALIGDRVAWVGCSTLRCTVSSLLVGTTPRVIEDVVALPAWSRVQALGLPDGALLVIGQRRASDPAQAFVVDLGLASVREVDASRAAVALQLLSDGTVAELDGSGLSLRRDRLITPYDQPPATLVAGDRELALDSAESWTLRSSDLVATVDEARIDVAGLRFARFSLTLSAAIAEQTQLRVVLDGSPDATIAISDTSLAIGSCRVGRSASDAAITITRDADAIALDGGAERARCSTSLPEHVSIALIADRNVALGPLQLQRL